MELPTNEIDNEIIQLVKNMNKIEGIQTVMSCAGHQSEDIISGYVSFKCESLKPLEELSKQLSPQFPIKLIVEGKVKQQVTIEKTYHGHNTDFLLRFESEISDTQRKIIEELTKLIGGDSD